MKLDKMYNRVKGLLASYPKYRYNKHALLAHILYESAPGHLQTPGLRAFLMLMSTRKLPSTETIERAWRKVIENNPEYQGDAYEARLQEAEEVKKEVKQLGLFK